MPGKSLFILGFRGEELYKGVPSMPEYDFQILQPNEFECLTRDLLQKREKIFIESFTPGRDSGIDLRFAYASSSSKSTTIVQAKRYKDYDSLLRSLKQEVAKVHRLSPKRYILSTSVGLTPGNKDEIANLFTPFIISHSDILGREDLNNLLCQFHDIENQYYKLWIGSTNVMDRILHRRIENWSGFEREEIIRDVSTYVMNDSFNKAMSILLKNRFVIISGIPGIGKTTLARMLVYKLLGEDYEEAIRVYTMDDAAEGLIEGKRQVFFFDDFLGANYFHVSEDGFESKVLRFIDAIRSKPDKLFILSTREYILKTAIRQYEHFALRNIELAKCTIDLEEYTEGVRAHILYNHLAEAEIPVEYIRQLLFGSQYLRLIKHKNFNPRIIEAFLNKQLYLHVSPTSFVQQFLDFFEHPNSVWDYAFCNMTPLAQYALFVRMTMGNGPVYLDEWYSAVKFFMSRTSGELSLNLTEITWEETLKTLEGTFVLTSKSSNALITGFQNPSVFDYLLDKVRSYEDVQGMLIKSALFADQIYNTFSDLPATDAHRRIYITADLYPAVVYAYNYSIGHYRLCALRECGSLYVRDGTSLAGFIVKMQNTFKTLFKNNPQLVNTVVDQGFLECSKYSLMNRMTLLDRLDEADRSKLDLEKLASVVYEQADWSADYVNIMDLMEMTEFGRGVMESGELLERVESSLYAELDSATSDVECDMIGDSAAYIAEKIPGMSADTWADEIEETKKRFHGEPDDDDIDEDWARESYYHSRVSVDNLYSEMFSSLLGQ